jgi:hypothetical protein
VVLSYLSYPSLRNFQGLALASKMYDAILTNQQAKFPGNNELPPIYVNIETYILQHSWIIGHLSAFHPQPMDPSNVPLCHPPSFAPISIHQLHLHLLYCPHFFQ